LYGYDEISTKLLKITAPFIFLKIKTSACCIAESNTTCYFILHFFCYCSFTTVY